MNTSKKYITLKMNTVLNILFDINQPEREKYFPQKPVNSFSKTWKCNESNGIEFFKS